MQVIVRKFKPDSDSGFIYSSYPKGVYHGSHTPINAGNDYQIKKKWFQDFYQVVKQQLANSTVLIACMSENPDTILGYAILTGTALEFVYVKELFRNQGIAKLLLKHEQVETYKNVTKVGHAILHKEGTTNGTRTNADE